MFESLEQNMAAKTMLIIVLVYFETGFSEREESCVVETDVKAKFHCRAGINECNTMALKTRFPHLFNQSYSSDGPEKVKVTAFCETRENEKTSYPGLEYRFSPPGHGGVTSILGFEVRLEGGPPSMSDFKCLIIELDNSLTLEHISLNFSSRFYPVARKMPYVVVFSSLPRKDNKYRNEQNITSKSCEYTATSADWKPSFCNISYDSDNEILNIVFEPPPSEFKFDQFQVTVTDLAKFKHTKTHINQTEFSVPNIRPGKYEIRIEPFNPERSNEKLCKCRNTDGRCDSCTEFIKGFTVEKNEIPETAKITKDNQVLPVILVPVLCILAGVVGVCVLIYLRKHGKLQLHKTIVDTHAKKPSISIIIEDNSWNQRQAADKLRTILSCVFGDNILLEVTADTKLLEKSKINLKIYITDPGATTAEMLHFVQLLEDNVAKIHETSEGSQSVNILPKHAVITFDSIPDGEIKTSNILHFQLMSDMQKLVFHLNSCVHLSQEHMLKRMQMAEYKDAYNELKDLTKGLKQESDNSETKLFVEIPCFSGACRGESLQSRCLSNNSEPDSGIRSGDEFESLNSSEETMNENMQKYNRNENWIRSMNSQSFEPNSGYPYSSMPYNDTHEVTNQNLDWENRKIMAEHTVPRCPSEIQFFAPEPSEYSEYGEDTFFDEANKTPIYALRNPVPKVCKNMNPYNHVGHSVAYHKVYPKDIMHNERKHGPPMKQQQRQNVKNKKSKEMHDSMESLMDKMADVNTRYQNATEIKCMPE